jgi:hypothetical protein
MDAIMAMSTWAINSFKVMPEIYLVIEIYEVLVKILQEERSAHRARNCPQPQSQRQVVIFYFLRASGEPSWRCYLSVTIIVSTCWENNVLAGQDGKEVVSVDTNFGYVESLLKTSL